MVDTRLSKEFENQVRTEWGGQVFFSSFSSQARGVTIFFRKDLPVIILDHFSDQSGNICSILIEFETKKILVEGIYGPNNDSPDFYSEEVFKRIQNWNPSYALYAGDWNIIQDPVLDTKGYQNLNNPRARTELISKINELNLIDIFRNLNPTAKKFTWKQWGNNKMARLDYFLISSSLLPFVQKVETLTKCYSDHCPIFIEIDFSKFQRGKGFWKLNNSLLYNPEYVAMIKDTIKNISVQYAVIKVDNINYLETCSEAELEGFLAEQSPESLQALQLKINPELFLDVLLMEIRHQTIQFSAGLKRKRESDEKQLVQDIKILENNVEREIDNVEDVIAELEQKRESLEKIYNYQAQGAYIRSRATYKIEGERPTKLFCALERHNGIQKYVPQLIVKNEIGQDKTISTQKEVEDEIFRFYNELYENKDAQLEFDNIEHFFYNCNTENDKKMSNFQKQSMEGNITFGEMTKYLKKTKNSVLPGTSGFTNEFYKFFWRDLKIFIINAVKFAFDNNRLSVTQNYGIISIIPKGNKDKRYLSNWRPITLLNTLYKLISGCIAERIKPVLHSLIHPDQKGFVAGRYIGEAIRTTYDIMDYAKQNNLAGLLLCIDFEKAYDSISFKFIESCLNYFNFGTDLIKWVRILLYDFKAVINHCGNISKSFDINRGCRQGDPIASYLFIMCLEILALKMRADPQIRGFKIGNMRHLLEIYADDLTVFLDPSSDCLYKTIKVLQGFYKLSGLKISVKKTCAVWFGKNHDSNIELCPELGLKWSKSFTLLGITFDNNLEKMQSNFNEKIDKIEKLLFTWSHRYLTPFGKVTIVKTLGLSKISHVALVIPNPNKDMLKRLDTLFFKFIWDKRSEKVNREDAKLPLTEGGLGMPDIPKFWTGFKFSWFRRLLTTDSFWPKIIQIHVNEILGANMTISDIVQLGASKLKQISKSLKNNFWKQVFSSVTDITEGASFCCPEKLLSSPFLYNNLVLRNNKVINERVFPELTGIVSTLSDFYLPGTNQLMEWEEFKNYWNCNISREKFIDIRFILKLAIQKLKISSNKLLAANRPFRPFLIDLAMSTKKGCSLYYKWLRRKAILTNKIVKRERKWHEELGTVYSLDFWNKTRHFCASICIDNRLLWLQYQIVRNSLQTNYIVSHFMRNVSSRCHYCQDSNELISHLFYSCNVVKHFLDEVSTFFMGFNFDFSPNKIEMLFGFHKLDFTHPKNYISLVFKRYIWITKFKSCNLNLNGFRNFLKSYVVDIKYIFDMKKDAPKHLEWNPIYVSIED